ncbi:DegT/DnrJ/EryC1/StrS family aminotransferase [Anditalea andensis]|uniref:Aminotransferase DegT n=1 Tax=Anditalea andensis TaxID=1048983 RepID=A0A074L3F2_9BACT|nr:DegT/DnrJ/EryC1/StrS family aminotransferase [Anditalea andensis]KEO75005.1 aminotransferase DegT [Anditalea andensis]
MLNVTKTYLPPLDEYTKYLEGIWSSAKLTNYGPLVQKLEADLKSYLGVKHLFFVNNGTLALQIAIKALGLSKKIITTPFSYVATTSSIVWEGCEPIFADIEKDTLSLDPSLIEDLITPDTEAILATHVYGIPCDVERIQAIADKHNLKVIYDAAHAFGVKFKDSSILNYGDVSTISFHATKLFHTGEGGAIVTDNDEIAYKISYMMNFGHDGPEKFVGIGINGKNSEIHAALGLCILPKVGELMDLRKSIHKIYDDHLAGNGIIRPYIGDNVTYNFAYYPVILPSEQLLLKVIKALNQEDIFPRRYFYPSLADLNYVQYEGNLPVTDDVCARILCLPLFHDLSEDNVINICSIIEKCIKQ